ncbi:MAG: carbohydrate binding domain-containing protein, partial [Phycisphaerales bacterium]
MRTRIVWLTTMLIVFMGFALSQGQEVENLLTNPGLEDGTASGWGGYGDNTREVVQELVGATVPEAPIEGDYCLHVTVGENYENFWDAGLTLWGGGVFESGKQYTFSFWAKSKEGEREINLKPEQTDTWIQYGEKRITITEEWAEYFTTSPVMTEDVPNMQISVHVGFGPGEFWLDAARLYVGEYVETVFGPRVKATAPNPADGSDNVAQDVTLSWEPGPFAAVHDVYFGENFDDVNNGDPGTLVSSNQFSTTFDPPDDLEFGKTYYWRIDEVNAPPDSTVFPGDVWSFTVEQYLFPISNIGASASSSFSSDMGADKTVDGSGLDASDLHSAEPTDMWLSEAFDPDPTWIQFEFDVAHPLAQMDVWNSNQLLEPVIGVGVNDVTVEYSEDGDTWTTLGDFKFAQAPGLAGYATDTSVNMGGALAQYVRLTTKSNWGVCLDQFGLSEVRFFFIPVRASDPMPAEGDSDVPLDVVLDWRGGRQAVSHEVYLSKDEAAVIDGTAL